MQTVSQCCESHRCSKPGSTMTAQPMAKILLIVVLFGLATSKGHSAKSGDQATTTEPPTSVSTNSTSGSTDGTNVSRSGNAMELIMKLTKDLKDIKKTIETKQRSYPEHCLAAKQQGGSVSGVYTIRPDWKDPFEVWCDMETDSGGWTLFQRREDSSVNFQRNFIDYVRGFGNVSGEHWLGLDKIHRLTRYSDFEQELWIDLEDFDGKKVNEHYNRWHVRGPPSFPHYDLYVAEPSGNAGDSLVPHHTYVFSTPDLDTIGYGCALKNEGGWWFHNCQNSHLNGKYYYGTSPAADKGILWNTFRGTTTSLKRTEMKTRPSRLSWRQVDQ